MPKQDEYTVDQSLAGARLDRAAAEMMPGSGLRLRRRLCETGRIEVDGRPRGPGYKVRPGQVIALVAPQASGEENVMPDDQDRVRVIVRTSALAAVYKPGGLHSASVAGKVGVTVEAALPELFPNLEPIMLNRLDFLTSGLILVGLGPGGLEAYRAAEEAGAVRKFYLARVRGRLDGMITVRRRLDTDDRPVTGVLTQDDLDPRRWTDVAALSHDAETTLVRCLIMKGARHQIRAHLASLGHPIVGDPLYGEPVEGRAGATGPVMFLHHQRVELPGFLAEVEPPWR
ncbi:RluA family pseudouridine synthase [Pseudodesulfovibrio sp. F-1]|uniref:RluA family pseudouridine synthase n=1 Tax=Pseudodesulfovibrio alkaliphilus TaxID=2661613 RepID=A0A7K1KRW6_9BACT|nr:RluA family pseudouridine synthase [Pseudodesulfovibrio alkaliphilus]MUM78814.1 RluA family pseudouridine synthase [Pseudodesulfovibrio alkaliphilus]